MRRCSLFVAAALLGGCRAQPSTADPTPCAPTSAALSAGASAEGLPGEYRLQLVATSGAKAGAIASGSLRLMPLAASRRHTLPDGRTNDKTAFVLHGTSDVSLGLVGAEAGDLSSTDPSRPGVLVMSLAPSGSGGPRILLRLGSEANRSDLLRFDGAYTVLRVQEIGETGFRGEWESGAPLPQASGHFCAERQAAAN